MNAIEGMFVSQSCVHVINTRMALATMQKSNSSISEYVAKMRGLADDMASTGKKLDDEDLVSYILAGRPWLHGSNQSRLGNYSPN